MLINHEREKLIQSVIYFAKNTEFCGKVKLFKLLYFLDFEHYKMTGRSVTGLKYSRVGRAQAVRARHYDSSGQNTLGKKSVAQLTI
jgi:hypothetical protein